MGEMVKMTVKTNDGNEFHYTLDTVHSLIGHGMANCPIEKIIDSDLKIINEDVIKNLIVTKNELNTMFLCNMDISNLLGKYYDKNGFVYYTINNNQIYRFDFKIKDLKKQYRNKNNGT